MSEIAKTKLSADDDLANGSPWMTGRILLAMPAMGDPRFHRAVIFICAHDANGAMGLVINQTMPGLEFTELLDQLHIPADPKRTENRTVLSGGPVEATRGFVLHTGDYAQKDTIRVNDRFSVTGTIDALKAIASGAGPREMLFLLGYAGWGAGQLDQELQENAWLVADSDPRIIFGADPEAKWDEAMKSLGIDAAMLSADAGRA